MDNGACSYRRYLDGEEDAFDEIVKELFDPLLFFIDRYVHDLHASEDIAMDAFTDLVVHRHRYDGRVTLKTYLFMIGRSRALNYLKYRKRRSYVSLAELDYAVGDADAEKQFYQREEALVLHEALSTLSDDMQAAVHLVYFEGLSYEEAARIMKKNKKQIDNLLYRARLELRNILGKEVVGV